MKVTIEKEIELTKAQAEEVTVETLRKFLHDEVCRLYRNVKQSEYLKVDNDGFIITWDEHPHDGSILNESTIGKIGRELMHILETIKYLKNKSNLSS